MKISVLQWNVWVKEKADHVLSLIKTVDADIVCLQELTANSNVNLERNLPKELSSLGYQSFFFPTIKRDLLTMGNGVFSKLPIEKSRYAYVRKEGIDEDLAKMDPMHEYRAYVEATVKAGSSSLTVGTAHMSFTPRFTSTPWKEAETKRLLEAIEPNQQKFIFCGDLNALPNSNTIRQLDEVLVPAGPDYSQATWTTKPFQFEDFEANSLDWRLDYIYTTPDIKVLSAKIVKTDYSDHLPILLEIELPN